MSDLTQKLALHTILRCRDCGTLRWPTLIEAREDGTEQITLHCTACDTISFKVTDFGRRDRRKRSVRAQRAALTLVAGTDAVFGDQGRNRTGV